MKGGKGLFHMREFAIDGHDGAGKTPVIERVTHLLTAAGARVYIAAPLQEANRHAAGGQIYSLWERDETAVQAMQLVSSAIRSAREEATEQRCDVLLFDRHWLTVMAEVADRPIGSLWTDFVPLFFLTAPPSKTMACQRFSFDIPWTSSKEKIAYYYARYLQIAERYGMHVRRTFSIERRDTDLTPVVEQIVADILVKGDSTS